jgi:hypothetical protein
MTWCARSKRSLRLMAELARGSVEQPFWIFVAKTTDHEIAVADRLQEEPVLIVKRVQRPHSLALGMTGFWTREMSSCKVVLSIHTRQSVQITLVGFLRHLRAAV